EPADVLFAFCVGAIGEEQLALLHADNRRRRGRTEPVGEDPNAGGLHLLIERAHVAHDHFKVHRRRRSPVRLIDGEEIGVHGFGPSSRPAGAMPTAGSTLTRMGAGEIDTARQFFSEAPAPARSSAAWACFGPSTR